MVTLPVTLGDT